MCKLIDLIGQKFGRYTVIERNGVGPNGMAAWLCQCDCGNRKTVIGNSLRQGHVVSCGCYQKEVAIRNGLATKKHGETRTPTYKTWISMKARCFNSSDQAYEHYGGRGITVCERWANSYELFVKDMGKRPRGMSIERINVDGNYEPQNCIWATPKQQARNRRCTIKVIYQGEKMSLIQAAEQSGIPYQVLRERKQRLKWPDDRLFSSYTKRKRSTTNALQAS